MASYAIGDIQGCHDAFQALLDTLCFDPARDRLWLVGDLVNRGPDSLRTLRLVRSLGDAAISVLGNHDLYLLKVASSGAATRKRHDTLQPVLDAPDRDELLDWLRRRPLMHLDLARGLAMVHAGLLPCWTAAQAQALAAEVQAVLSSDAHGELLAHLWGNQPDAWRDDLQGIARYRVIVNAMTRMRFCSLSGRMEFDAKGGPHKAPPDHLPWFEHPQRATRELTVVCGHWSALGLRIQPGLVATDTGCVWGGALTAVCLEDRQVHQVPAAGQRMTTRKHS